MSLYNESRIFMLELLSAYQKLEKFTLKTKELLKS